MFQKFFCLVTVLTVASAYDQLLAFGSDAIVETRSMDELYRTALDEGRVVTLWYGGALKTQQDAMKSAFEKRFPGVILNVTVDESKYHEPNINRQLAEGTSRSTVRCFKLYTVIQVGRVRAS